MENPMQEQQESTRPVLGADRASWLQDRLRSYKLVVQYLDGLQGCMVTADEEMIDQALAGATRGQAREIARTLGFEPGENLEPLMVVKG